jgi:hypothetical protein
VTPPRRLVHLFVLVAGLRLLAWALLLPPWSGYDEPFHHSLVLDQAEHLQWPAFRQTRVRPELVAETRRWPISGPYRFLSESETNYETQQSPAYYWIAGLALRPFRAAPSIATLYALRLGNAALALLAIVVTAGTARRLFGDRDWLPVAYAALVPGLGLALTRVCNDALAAAAISLAVAGSLGASRWWTLAAGIAPWAKLYGGAALPGAAWPIDGERRLAWLARAGTIAGPVLLFLFFSWRVHGRFLPIQEDLHPRASVGLAEVSWTRNLWTIAKSHVFFSGMPVRVFPKPVYAIALSIVAAALFWTWRRGRRDRRALALLCLPLLLFWVALLYHSWRTTAFFRSAGATGGWYLWAMLLPESLLVTWGLATSARECRLPVAAALSFFLLLTAMGDVSLVLADGGGLVVLRDTVVGVRSKAVAAATAAFLRSRPSFVAGGAIAVAIASWVLSAFAIFRSVSRWEGGPTTCNHSVTHPAEPTLRDSAVESGRS